MCLAKVNFLSDIIPRIVKESCEFREVLLLKRSECGGNMVLDLLTCQLSPAQCVEELVRGSTAQ